MGKINYKEELAFLILLGAVTAIGVSLILSPGFFVAGACVLTGAACGFVMIPLVVCCVSKMTKCMDGV